MCVGGAPIDWTYGERVGARRKGENRMFTLAGGLRRGNHVLIFRLQKCWLAGASRAATVKIFKKEGAQMVTL